MHSSITSDPAKHVEPDLSVVIPALNEAAGIRACLGPLLNLKERGAEIILVDGGSTDRTVELARDFCDRIVQAPRGRALQMNAGAGVARGEVLLFLHADTRLPARADCLIRQALAHEPARVWGRFDVDIDGAAPMLRTVARAMSLRSRLSGIATGDQALFCRRDAFMQAQGFPPLPIMEDIAFSRLMRRRSWPICLKARVTTSGRRWESHGIARTILLMWSLRLGYALGIPASTLSAWYRYDSGPRSSASIRSRKR